jgi:hypothetical protein
MRHSYNDQLITFGALLKNFGPGPSWDVWQTKFEALLRTMAWDVANVSLDIESDGRYYYIWKQDDWHWSDYDRVDVAFHALGENARRPVERWTFSGGRRGESEF